MGPAGPPTPTTPRRAPLPVLHQPQIHRDVSGTQIHKDPCSGVLELLSGRPGEKQWLQTMSCVGSYRCCVRRGWGAAGGYRGTLVAGSPTPTPAEGGWERLRAPPAGEAPGPRPASRARPLPATGRLGPGCQVACTRARGCSHPVSEEFEDLLF